MANDRSEMVITALVLVVMWIVSVGPVLLRVVAG